MFFPLKRKYDFVWLKLGSILLLVLLGTAGASADWRQEWEKTLEAAKKEGQLNFYVGRYGQRPLLEKFSKKYPEIKLVTVNGRGSQMSARILTEVRAGRVVADIFSSGANSNYNMLYRGKVLAPFKPLLLLPEVVDESKWLGGVHRYTDPEQKHIFIYIANVGSRSLSYNTNLVNPKEFKSYWDLVNPKWKGKFAAQRITGTGMGANMQFYYYHDELGPKFISQLFGTMDVTFGDRRQITDWLAKGRVAICLGCRQAERAKRQGLPVDVFDARQWKEGQAMSTGGGSMSYIKGAPHPNAAKVFVNWFLSREGQLAVQSSPDLYGELAPSSRRIDIPKDMLDPRSSLLEGRKYFDVADPKYADMAPIFKLAREIMAEVRKAKRR